MRFYPPDINYYPLSPAKVRNTVVEKVCFAFACQLETHRSEVISILTTYETHQVAYDELARSLDLLMNIDENRQYFTGNVRGIAALLPKNQPLYALCCFALIPSFQALQVSVRPPTVTRRLFERLAEVCELRRFFPNVELTFAGRQEFIRESTSLCQDDLGREVPRTSVVIFTGSLTNGEKLRREFHPSTLFIGNGAGHNPVVISADANLQRAAEAVIEVQFYNQGQDCAAPAAILVHSSVQEEFLCRLRKLVSRLRCGPYRDRKATIGPITEQTDLSRIQEILLANSSWLDPATPGRITVATSQVEPTLIVKPLRAGGNYAEQFAPIAFIQEYGEDSELSLYFEDPRYAPNAMYVTLFGSSSYVDSLPNRRFRGNPLHDEATIIRDTHLHATGVERGVKPYGGYGRAASYLCRYGQMISKPTLPQRDIWEHLLSNEGALSEGRVPRQVADLGDTPSRESRYGLLSSPNTTYWHSLTEERRKRVIGFQLALSGQTSWESLTLTDLNTDTTLGCSTALTKDERRELFKDLYMLLIGRPNGPSLTALMNEERRLHILKLLSGSETPH